MSPLSTPSTADYLRARNAADRLPDGAREVLASARAEELHTDGNSWWDALTVSSVKIHAVSWCRGAELIEATAPSEEGPRRTFRLTAAGRLVAQLAEVHL